MPQSPIATQGFAQRPNKSTGPAQADANGNMLTTAGGQPYVACPVSATTALQTVAGAKGDTLQRLIISPITLAAAAVQIKDGANTAITVFTAGTLADLKPFEMEFDMVSSNGGWSVITGANVTAIAVGRFS